MGITVPNSSELLAQKNKLEAMERVYDAFVNFYREYLSKGGNGIKARAFLLTRFIDDKKQYDLLHSIDTGQINKDEKFAAMEAALFDVLLEMVVTKKSKKEDKGLNVLTEKNQKDAK